MPKIHDQFDAEVGNTIRELREEKGWTQEQLAGMVGITSHHLSCIELGKRSPSLAVLHRIIEHLDVSADRIFFGRKQETNVQDELEHIGRLLSRCSLGQCKLIADLIELIVEKGYAG